MPTNTARLDLQQPIGTDAPSAIRVAITANTNTLDDAALYASGTLATRPVANTIPAGSVYYATDVGAYCIANGSAWSLLGSPSPVGAMSQYAGASDPVDADGVTRWLVCDGRAIVRATYAALFTALGTTYGTGNGSTTFNIPDGRGRALAQVDGGAGRLHAQTISGVTNQNTLAGTGGSDTETLSTAEMPAHSHGVTDPGHAHGTNLTGLSTMGVGGNAGDWATGLGAGPPMTTATTGITGTQSAGSGNAHNNAQPYLVVNHIIRVL